MNYLTIFLYWKLYALGMVSFTTSVKKNTKEKYLGGRCSDMHPQCDLSIRSLFSRGVKACQHNCQLYFGRQFENMMILTLKSKSFRSTCWVLSFTGAIHLPLKFLKRGKRKTWTLDPFSLSFTKDKPGVSFTSQMRWFSVILLPSSLLGKVKGQLSRKRSNTTLTSFVLVTNRDWKKVGLQ